MAINAGSIVAFLELDTSKFSKGFASAFNELKVFADQSSTATQKTNGLASAMSITGGILTKSVSVPLAGVGALAVKVTSDFESGMSNVKAISGATGEEFEQLKQKAIEMGAETKFSASDAADAFNYMAMAGWDASDMMNGISGIMDLAAASGEDLATTSDIVTDALTAFGLQASDSAHFADVLAEASAKSNTNVGLMGDTFRYVAPVAGALGYSVEDTAVAIGLMANSGIKASQAGTSLRQILTNLTHPVGQAEDAINDLGISITNADGTTKPLSQTMEELRQKFSGMTEAEKAQYAAMLAGQEGMSGLLAIVNASESDFQNLTNEINNATGAAGEMADVMMDNTAGAVEQLKGALESAGIIVGEQLTPYIRDLAEWITDLVEDFNDLSEEQQQNIVKWALMATAAGPFLIVGSKAIKTISGIGNAFVTTVSGASKFIKAMNMARNSALEPMAQEASGLYRNLPRIGTALLNLLNPTALMGSSIALLTVGMIAANEADKLRIKSLGELTGEEKELASAIDRTNESYQNIAENREKAIDDASTEAQENRNLWNELKNITDENGKITAGNEQRAKVITGLLSDALGQEITITDGVIDNYGELSASIQDTIEKQQALAIQEAMSEDYAEALKNKANAQQEYNEALEMQQKYSEKVSSLEEEIADKSDEWAEAMSKGGKYAAEASEEQANMNDKLEIYKEKLKNATDSTDKARESLEGYNETIQNYEGLSAAIVSGSADEINNALLKIEQGFLTASTGTKEGLEEQVKTIQEQYENMKEEVEKGNTNVTQEMVDQMKNLSDQATSELKAYMDNSKNQIVTSFQQLGVELPEAASTAFAESTSQVQQSVLSMLQAVQDGTQLKKTELSTLFTSIGMDVPNAMITQLSDMSPQVQAQAINLLAQFQYGEAEKRPEVLEQMKDLGIKIDENWAGGIDANAYKVTNSSSSVGSQGHDAMNTAISKDKLDAPDVDSVGNAEQEAKNARSTMQGYFDENPLSVVVNVVKAGLSALSNFLDGSHANGLSYVPFDGYIAELHKGERVLTAQENKSYNEGSTGGGDTFIFYGQQETPYETARQIKKMKTELLKGF